jgi:hypothetical protein
MSSQQNLPSRMYSSLLLSQLVETNQHHILKAIEAQNLEKYDEALEYNF